MDEVIRETERIWARTKDCCDDSGNADAQRLIGEARQVYEDAKSQKSRDHMIDAIKRLQKTLDSYENRTDIYSPQDIDGIRDQCERLKEKLHEL